MDEIPTLADSSLSPESETHHVSPPSPSVEVLRANIIKQVEYYLSDENLPNDKFLLKQLNKDIQGFVSISLIASFRKMKKLTNDISLIVDALKDSSHLVVSSDGKKVKRLHPLPSLPSNNDKNPKLCTVVVENLPEDCSLQNIRKICSQAGSIKSITLHDPHGAEDLKECYKADKLLGGKEEKSQTLDVAIVSSYDILAYAVVEYEKAEAAEKAVATLNNETDWRSGLRVVPLKNRKGYVHIRKACRGSNSGKDRHAHVGIVPDDQDNNHLNDEDHAVLDEDGEHTTKDRQVRKGRKQLKGRKHGNSGMGHGTASIAEPTKPPPGPRMPDGTRGFTMGRGQPFVSNDM